MSTTGGDVYATLHFFSPPTDGSRPQFLVTDPSGTGVRNYPHDPQVVLIRDLRGREGDFKLEKHGFAAIQETSSLPAAIRSDGCVDINVLYPEIERLVLKHVESSSRIFIFDHTTRSTKPGLSPCKPVRKVHIDQTPQAVKLRLDRHLGKDDANALLRRHARIRLINVWFPLNPPVLDHPLAFASSESVYDEDLVEVDHIYPDRTGQTYGVKYNTKQEWWYWSEMQNDEMLLLTCFDGVIKDEGMEASQSVRVAHASFAHPLTPEGVAERSSIEVRCLVVG